MLMDWGRFVYGGSTITQQLARNLFDEIGFERRMVRKLKEVQVARDLERSYTKDQILEAYLNEIYMGQQEGTSINGMGEATRYYFGHDVKNLSLAEAALLAGLIRAPNFYSPFLHPDRARKRRDFVLKKMFEAGMITRETYEKAVKEPVTLPSLPGTSRDNLYYVDFLKRQLESFYPAKVLTGRGLRIFTTLRPEFQEAAAHFGVVVADEIPLGPVEGNPFRRRAGNGFSVLLPDTAAKEQLAQVVEQARHKALFRVYTGCGPEGDLSRPDSGGDAVGPQISRVDSVVDLPVGKNLEGRAAEGDSAKGRQPDPCEGRLQ